VAQETQCKGGAAIVKKGTAAIIFMLSIISVLSPVSAQSGGCLTRHYLYSLGSHTDINSGWSYIWYDADRDGIIDLDQEVETVVSSINEYDSTSTYPTGANIYVFADADGYYPQDKQFVIPEIPSEYDGVTPQPVGIVHLIKKTSDLDVNIFVPYIANGSQTSMSIAMRITDADTGFGGTEMIDFDSGRVYTSPILVAGILHSDVPNIMFYDYDRMFSGPTHNYFFWELDRWFNDADVETDSIHALTLAMDTVGPFSLYITIYDTMLEDYLQNGVVALPSQPTFKFNGTENCYNTTKPRVFFQEELDWVWLEGFKNFGWYEDGGQVINDDYVFPFNDEILGQPFLYMLFMMVSVTVGLRIVTGMGKSKSSKKLKGQFRSPPKKVVKPKPKPRFIMDADIYILGDEVGEDYE
jgi:hypothetical protein